MAHSWSPCRAPWQVKLVFHKGTPQSSQFIQAESAMSLIHLEGKLLHSKTALTQEREILWQGEVHTGENPLMLG
jgi:hypothetical protein